MGQVERVLASSPVTSLNAYEAGGGGAGLRSARALPPVEVIEHIEASGLRGRGGGGFPTGRKWRKVHDNEVADVPAAVVVNGAEGEPGCFKDRAMIRANPYALLEGALIAAHAVDAEQVIIGLKRTFTTEVQVLDAAITELARAGWSDGVEIDLFEGPSEYLYGEETALLEAIDGRYPFPRVAPPFRRGVDEIVEEAGDVTDSSSSAAHVEMAGPSDESVAPPTLAENVETLMNVAAIIDRGADWFRSVGTKGSPGTIVATVTGRVRRAGVAEFALGTPLREIVTSIGGGPEAGNQITAVMSGVSNAIIPAAALDTPATYEDLAKIGSGLGTAGFIVFDDTVDLTAVAAGVAHFLAVESCGQCRHCKQDGLELAGHLADLSRSAAEPSMRPRLDELVASVTEGARCNLPYQIQAVVGSVLELAPALVGAHLHGSAPAAEPEFIAPLVSVADGKSVLDEHARGKQPDWSYGDEDSGQWPADRYDDHRMHDTR